MPEQIAQLETLIRVRTENADALPQLQSQLERLDRTASNSTGGLQAFGNATRNAGAESLRLAQTEARGLGIKNDLGAASERLGGAIAQYRAQMGGTTAEAIRLANAENQLASVQQKIAGSGSSVSSSLSSLKDGMGGLTAAAGALGIAFGAQQIVQFGVNAAQASLQLQQNENALKQIAGSQEVYNQILQAAKQQQIAFGGSLADNLGELSSFAVAARTTGASLQDLIRTAQRLATLDPEQGIKGAKLALNEALSGNAGSLNKRFEIPKAALDGLADSSTSAADKLAIVNKYLDDAGISANGMADAIPAGTRAINELNAALDTLKTTAGAGLADAFTPAIQGATQLAQALNGNATAFQGFAGTQQAINTTLSATGQAFTPILGQLNAYNNVVIGTVGNLLGYNSAQNQANVAALQGAQTFAQYNAAVQQSGTGAAALTQQQFAIAQGFIAQGQSAQLAIQSTQALSAAQQQHIAQLTSEGVAMQAALTQAQGLDTTFNAIAVAQQALADSGNASAASISNLGSMMQSAASGSAQAAATVNALAVEFSNGSITAEQLFAALQDVINANTAATSATSGYVGSLTQGTSETINATQASFDYAQSLLQSTDALVEETQKKLESATQTEQLNALQATLAELGPAVAGGLMTAAGAAAQLAGQYNITTQAALNLVAAQAQLAQMQAGIANQAAIKKGGLTGVPESYLGAITGGKSATDYNKNVEALRKASDAQRAYNQALGSATSRQAAYQEAVDLASNRYGEYSAEAIKARQALAQFDAQQDKANAKAAKGTKVKKAGGAGSGGVKLSDQQKLDNSLAAQQDKFLDQTEQKALQHQRKLEDFEQEHQDRILKIQADALAKQKAQADKNEVDKRESEVGFLERLTGSDLNKSKTGGQADLQRINAQYYQQFDAAQKAAQQGDVARSQQLLDLAEKRSSLELDYAERIDAARQKKDTNEVGRLQTLLGMRRQILDVEDQQAAQGGDSIKAEAAKQLADENTRYAGQVQDENANFAQSLDDIALKADQSADRQVSAAQRAGKAIDTQKLSVDALAQSYQNLGTTLAATPGTSPNGVPTSTPVLPAAPVAPTSSTDTLTNVFNGLGAKLDAIAGKLDALTNLATHDDLGNVVSTLGSVGRDIKGAVGFMPRGFQ